MTVQRYRYERNGMFYDEYGSFVASPDYDALAERERALREMLAYAYGGAFLYRDDGELQDNSALPCIDFRRDSVDDIQAKMRKRLNNALAAPDSAAPTGEAE